MARPMLPYPTIRHLRSARDVNSRHRQFPMSMSLAASSIPRSTARASPIAISDVAASWTPERWRAGPPAGVFDGMLVPGGRDLEEAESGEGLGAAEHRAPALVVRDGRDGDAVPEFGRGLGFHVPHDHLCARPQISHERDEPLVGDR